MLHKLYKKIYPFQLVLGNVNQDYCTLLTVGYDQINPCSGTIEEMFWNIQSDLNLLLDAMNERNVSHLLSVVKLAILLLFNR
jgi:hypothetical protein